MSRLWRTHGRTDTHVKVEQYSAEAESAKSIFFCQTFCSAIVIEKPFQICKHRREDKRRLCEKLSIVCSPLHKQQHECKRDTCVQNFYCPYNQSMILCTRDTCIHPVLPIIPPSLDQLIFLAEKVFTMLVLLVLLGISPHVLGKHNSI